jgi:hypothetical protein
VALANTRRDGMRITVPIVVIGLNLHAVPIVIANSSKGDPYRLKTNQYPYSQHFTLRSFLSYAILNSELR